MEMTGSLLRCTEAQTLIDETVDPITQRLLRMAYVKYVASKYCGTPLPSLGDVDMLYVLTVLKDFLGEHDVLARTLNGEIVGAFFDDAM